MTKASEQFVLLMEKIGKRSKRGEVKGKKKDKSRRKRDLEIGVGKT